MNFLTRLLTLLALAVGSAASCPGAPAAKVLFIGKQPDHPFGTHMYLHTCEVLSKCLALNENVESVVSDGWPENQSVLESADTVVIYAQPAAEFLLDGPHRDQATKVLDSGVGLVTIHWASSVKKENFERLAPRWMRYLGGTWISNVGLHTGESPLRQLAPDHPVCRGWEGYPLHDEYYLNPVITEDATAVLQVTAPKEPVVVGWAYQRENGGRSYATTLGHFYRNFQHEPFRRMVVNAILWTAHAEVPDGGANVSLSQQELALPSKPADLPKVPR